MSREEALNECVSRDKVIVQLNHLQSDWDYDWNVAIRKCIETIKKLPPVTAQPKMGKWKAFTHSAYHGNDEDGEPIWREVTVYHCNLCNRRTVIRENYCPNCGAEMRGDAE